MSPSVRLARRSLLEAALALPLVLGFSESEALARPRAQRLFTITRNTNRNVVCYDVRLRSDGSADPEEPVVAYWVMAAEDGRREGLTWLERRLAYGVETVAAAKAAGLRVRLNALESRVIAVERRPSGGYEARLSIAGKPARLRRIHVSAESGGVVPSVAFVDLFGAVLASGAGVVERLRP